MHDFVQTSISRAIISTPLITRGIDSVIGVVIETGGHGGRGEIWGESSGYRQEDAHLPPEIVKQISIHQQISIFAVLMVQDDRWLRQSSHSINGLTYLINQHFRLGWIAFSPSLRAISALLYPLVSSVPFARLLSSLLVPPDFALLRMLTTKVAFRFHSVRRTMRIPGSIHTE